MLGLEGYASDDSEDDKSAEERQPSSTLRNTLPEGAAGPSSRTVALPDAESLFSSSAAARSDCFFTLCLSVPVQHLPACT